MESKPTKSPLDLSRTPTDEFINAPMIQDLHPDQSHGYVVNPPVDSRIEVGGAMLNDAKSPSREVAQTFTAHFQARCLSSFLSLVQ